MVRLSFIMSLALAAQGIQAASAVRIGNVEPRNSVIQHAQDVPADYPGANEKRAANSLSDNSQETTSRKNTGPLQGPAKIPNSNFNPEVPTRSKDEEKKFQEKLEADAARLKSSNPKKTNTDGSNSKQTGPKNNNAPGLKPAKIPNSNFNPEVPTRSKDEEKKFQEKLEADAARLQADKKQRQGQRGKTKFNDSPEGIEFAKQKAQEANKKEREQKFREEVERNKKLPQANRRE